MNHPESFQRHFRDPIRVPRIREYYHRVPRIREYYHRVPRIRETGSLQVHTGYKPGPYRSIPGTNRVPTGPYRVPNIFVRKNPEPTLCNIQSLKTWNTRDRDRDLQNRSRDETSLETVTKSRDSITG